MKTIKEQDESVISLMENLKLLSEIEALIKRYNVKGRTYEEIFADICQGLQHWKLFNGNIKPFVKALFEPSDVIKESAELAKVAAGDDDRRTANLLNVGDQVEITGKVNFQGDTGKLESFGKDKKFCVVKLDDGGSHSFHSSDVSEVQGVEEPEDDGPKNKFYVAFYDQDEERPWIGLITKESGGKWHEKKFKGKPEGRWGQSYMSYLTPDDIMTWIHKDYGRSVEIEGPFYNTEEAEDHVRHNWGTIKEAVKAPRKGTVAWEIEQKQKELDKDPEEIKRIEKIGNSDHKVGTAKVVHDKSVKEGIADNFERALDTEATMLVRALKEKRLKLIDLQQRSRNIDAEKKGFADIQKEMDKFQNEIAKLKEQLKKKQNKKVKESVVVESATWEVKVGFGDKTHDFKTFEVSAETKAEAKAKAKVLAKKAKLDKFVVNDPIMIKEAVIVESKFSAWEILNSLATNEHEAHSFFSLEDKDAARYIDMHKADEHAKTDYEKDKFSALSEKQMKHVINKHPEFLKGKAKRLFDEELEEPVEMSEDISLFAREFKKKLLKLNEKEVFTDIDDWKQAVKNSYPTKAAKMRFNGRMEGGKMTVSAEVPGEDRCFGVWDQDEEKGEILSEETSRGGELDASGNLKPGHSFKDGDIVKTEKGEIGIVKGNRISSVNKGPKDRGWQDNFDHSRPGMKVQLSAKDLRIKK